MFRGQRLLTALQSSCTVLPASFTSSYKQNGNFLQRLLLATAYRSLDRYGLNEGICNHLSAIAPSQADPSKTVMLLIPYGLHWSQVTPNNLIGLDENNEVVEGDGVPEKTASSIHRGVYQARPDVKSVMHTHMSYATAIACLKDPRLLMLHQNSTFFLDRLAVDNSYGGIANAAEEGRRIGNTLGDKDVLLMGHHGVLTVGKSISVAFDLMYFFERACTVQVLAQATGLPVSEMPLEVAKQTGKVYWDGVDNTADAHLHAHLNILAKDDAEFREDLADLGSSLSSRQYPKN